MERVWSHIKQKLSWEIYENLDGVKEKVGAFIEEFSCLRNSIYNRMGLYFIRPVYCCIILENWYWSRKRPTEPYLFL
jgi:hypothetical protein